VKIYVSGKLIGETKAQLNHDPIKSTTKGFKHLHRMDKRKRERMYQFMLPISYIKSSVFARALVDGIKQGLIHNLQ